jgi:hypothetical protein
LRRRGRGRTAGSAADGVGDAYRAEVGNTADAESGSVCRHRHRDGRIDDTDRRADGSRDAGHADGRADRQRGRDRNGDAGCDGVVLISDRNSAAHPFGYTIGDAHRDSDPDAVADRPNADRQSDADADRDLCGDRHAVLQRRMPSLSDHPCGVLQKRVWRVSPEPVDVR